MTVGTLFARFARISDDAIITKDLDGTITGWNAAAERLYGYRADEVISKSVHLIVPEDRRAEVDVVLARLRDGDEVGHHDTVRLARSGARLHVRVTIIPIHDELGRVVGAAKIVRQRDEEDHVRAEKRLRSILELSPDAMLLTDVEGAIVLANREAEKLFGYPLDELVGRRVEMLIPEGAREAHERHRASYVRAPSIRDMNPTGGLTARRRDGTTVPVEVRLGPLDASGGLLVCATVRDVSRRLETERLLAEKARHLELMNEELQSFVYAASHDLRAPLRGVQHLASWLVEDLGEDLSPDAEKHLRLLRARVERMEELLRSLLEYSRAGRLDATPEDVELSELVEEAVDALSIPDGIEIVRPTTPVSLSTPRAPLLQVLRNLVGNAVKHHDRADGRVTVSATTDGRWCDIAVSDDGPGIDPQFHDRVFQIFQTLRPRDEVEGTGIGLALVSKHVRAAGGTLGLESPVDGARGARFHFTWPLDWRREAETQS